MATMAPPPSYSPSYDPFHDCLKGRQDDDDEEKEEEGSFSWPWNSNWSCGQDSAVDDKDDKVATVLAAVARYADEIDDDDIFEDPRWWKLLDMKDESREDKEDACISMRLVKHNFDEEGDTTQAVVATPILFEEQGYDGISALYLDNKFEQKLRQGLVAGATSDIYPPRTVRRFNRFASSAPRRASLGDLTNGSSSPRAIAIRKEISDLTQLHAKGQLSPVQFNELKRNLLSISSQSSSTRKKRSSPKTVPVIDDQDDLPPSSSCL